MTDTDKQSERVKIKKGQTDGFRRNKQCAATLGALHILFNRHLIIDLSCSRCSGATRRHHQIVSGR